MKNKTCCFTGHRQLPQKKLQNIQKRLEYEITELIHQGVLYFGCGGALGFDTLAAQAVIKCRSTYAQIKLLLVLPCKEQEKYWSLYDKQVYEQIKLQADKITYTSEYYFKGCMQKRNRHLINDSRYCICYLNKKNGGTFYTVAQAIKLGTTIINLAE